MRYQLTKNGKIQDTQDNMTYDDNTSLCAELNRLDNENQQTKKAYRKCLLDKQRINKEYVRLQVKMELKE